MLTAAPLSPATGKRVRRILRIGDRALRIVTNEASIAAYVDGACERLIVGAGAEFDATAIDRGEIFWNGQTVDVSFNGEPLDVFAGCAPPLEAGIRAVAALVAATLRRLSGRRALYALGVAKGDVRLAIAAASGAGKTTLALELLRRRWSTFGDELLLLDRKTLVVDGVRLALMVREPSLDVLGDARVARATRGGSLVSLMNGIRTWHDVDVERTFGRDAIAAPGPLTHVVLYERSEDGTSSLDRISPAAAALEILPHFFIDALAPDDMWEAVDLFGRLTCVRLRAADHRAAAELVEQLA